MGKRPFNTTKGGKFMNPTDQARKEARKRELKKNKKQRQMVRTAVLKGKDPKVMLLGKWSQSVGLPWSLVGGPWLRMCTIPHAPPWLYVSNLFNGPQGI